MAVVTQEKTFKNVYMACMKDFGSLQLFSVDPDGQGDQVSLPWFWGQAGITGSSPAAPPPASLSHSLYSRFLLRGEAGWS